SGLLDRFPSCSRIAWIPPTSSSLADDEVCLLTPPEHGGARLPTLAAREASMRSLPGWRQPGTAIHDLLRNMMRAGPAESPVVHVAVCSRTGVDGAGGAVLSDGDQLLAGGHQLIGYPRTFS